jgi:hypothetical protein
MAHFAQIDDNNVVINVVVVPNEQEHRGQEFLAEDLRLGGRWIQTSYNAKFRNKYAGIGDYYDEVEDVFISPIVEDVFISPIVEDEEEAVNDGTQTA